MIRAAVCGLGIGMAHCAGYLAARNTRLVAVCDLLPERRRCIGGTFDAGSMTVLRGLFEEGLLGQSWEAIGARVFDDLDALLDFDEFDVVSLCTPDYLHAEQALEILQAGKHLLLEKPVGLTRAQAERAVQAAAAAQSHGLKAEVAYEFRCNPAIVALRDLIEGGAIGTVEAISVHHFRTPFKRDKWRRWIQQRRYSGGLIVEETSHWFDLLRFLCAGEIEDVRCVTTDRIHPDFDFEDVAFIDGLLTGRVPFQIAHSLAGFDFSLTVAVYGSRATAWCGLKENVRSLLDGGSSDHIGIVLCGDPNHPGDEVQTLLYGDEAGEPETIKANVIRFAETLESDAPVACSFSDGLRALEASLLAGLSARQNRVLSKKEVDSLD